MLGSITAQDAQLRKDLKKVGLDDKWEVVKFRTPPRDDAFFGMIHMVRKKMYTVNAARKAVDDGDISRTSLSRIGLFQRKEKTSV